MESHYLGNRSENKYSNRPCSFEGQFAAFARHSDPKLNGNFITLSQSDEWMRQADVFDSNITPADTFNYFKSLGEMVNLYGYNWFLQNITTAKGVDFDETRRQMACCGRLANDDLNATFKTVHSESSVPYSYENDQGTSSSQFYEPAYDIESLYLGANPDRMSNATSYNSSHRVHFEDDNGDVETGQRVQRERRKKLPQDDTFVTEYMHKYREK